MRGSAVVPSPAGWSEREGQRWPWARPGTNNVPHFAHCDALSWHSSRARPSRTRGGSGSRGATVPARRDRDLRDLIEQIDVDPNRPSAPPKKLTRAATKAESPSRRARSESAPAERHENADRKYGSDLDHARRVAGDRALAGARTAGCRPRSRRALPGPPSRFGRAVLANLRGESANRAGLTWCAVRTRTAIARHRKPARERAAA